MICVILLGKTGNYVLRYSIHFVSLFLDFARVTTRFILFSFYVALYLVHLKCNIFKLVPFFPYLVIQLRLDLQMAILLPSLHSLS